MSCDNVIVKMKIKSVNKIKNDILVKYSDGSKERLISYYSDELKIKSDEFVGLTKELALELYRSIERNSKKKES